MIEHIILPTDSINSISAKLWDVYVDINYGRSVPEKGYKGFRSFLKDVTKATDVSGTVKDGFKLYFRDEKQYTWFLLKWA